MLQVILQAFLQASANRSSNPGLCEPLPCLLLSNSVATSNVQHIVKCAVPLNVEASLLVTCGLRGADTGRIGSTARSWVRVFGCGKSKRGDRGDYSGNLHFDFDEGFDVPSLTDRVGRV